MHTSHAMNIGIFFVVDGELVSESVPIEQASRYGDALEYGGHYAFWEHLKPATRAEWALKQRPYDAHPRGRVVFFPRQNTFVLYADRCLKQGTLRRIAQAFGAAPVRYARDEHYQCAGCNREYLE
ncbi:MAG: hypothetical protein ACFCUG_05250 [Thiotrichales bacterium]